MAKVLIIEDDPLIVKIYTTRLTADGYEVLSAENGEDGLKLIEQDGINLIVLDLMMPRVDGFGLLEKIRSTEKTKNIPVLVYSNLAQEEEVNRAKSLGATEFIVKANISPTEMVNKIKSYLIKNIPINPTNTTNTTNTTN